MLTYVGVTGLAKFTLISLFFYKPVLARSMIQTNSGGTSNDNPIVLPVVTVSLLFEIILSDEQVVTPFASIPDILACTKQRLSPSTRRISAAVS